MIKTRLLPPRVSPELSLATTRRLLAQAHSLAESQRAQTQRVIRSYTTWARRAGYQQGYEAGLAAAKNEVSELLGDIKRAYDTTIDTARADIVTTSRDLAQHIVDTALMEHPDALLRWIEQALVVLKRSRTIEIRYHPRLNETLRRLSPQLPEQIQLTGDDTLPSVDLVVLGDSGGVEFSRIVPSPKDSPYA